MGKPTLRALFLQIFTISACTFGGGFVIVTLMKKRLVEQQGWLSESEMLDMTALAQSAPGPIAVNTAVLVGWHLGGLPGMLTAVVGCILPPMVILSVISLFYTAFAQNPYAALRPVVVALIAGAFLSLLQSALWQGPPSLAGLDWLQALLFLCAFVLLRRKKPSPILTMFACGLLYLLLNLP